MAAVKRETLALHLLMAAACSALLGFCLLGSRAVSAPLWRALIPASAVLLPVSLLPALFWYDKGKLEERDAALTLPWLVLVGELIPWAAVLSGRFVLPLRDGFYLSLDRVIGVNVAAIATWTSSHSRAETLSNFSYESLSVLLPLAMLLPPLLGKKKAAEQFLLANTIAFLIGIPIFTLLPAVGPWIGYGFAGKPVQTACQASIEAIRHGGTAEAAGIICFPSFHVIWAILCAVALWSIKPLRIPSAILAALIVISTVTTGWHYACDVVAGIIFGVASLALADLLTKLARRPEQEFTQREREGSEQQDNDGCFQHGPALQHAALRNPESRAGGN